MRPVMGRARCIQSAALAALALGILSALAGPVQVGAASSIAGTFDRDAPRVSFQSTGIRCRETNNPPVDLGTLSLYAGHSLYHSGNVPGTVSGAPCTDSSGRSSVYFRFAIAEGEAGAIRIEAPRGVSSMSPDLLLRAGTSYTSTPRFRDLRNNVDDALAIGMLDAGTYTLQLRAGAALSGQTEAAGGPYDLTVTRLQPTLLSSVPEAGSITTIWDLGGTVSVLSTNRVQLEVMIEYRASSEFDWTPAADSLSPARDENTVTHQITGLQLGNTYHVRAAYTNAGEYTESGGIETKARILLTGAPYGVLAEASPVDRDRQRYRVRVAWESPPINADDNIRWGFVTRIDGGEAVPNPLGREHDQETAFLYSASAIQNGVLSIEVINTFECPVPGPTDRPVWTECDLSYNDRYYAIPAGSHWSTPWSTPGLAYIRGQGVEAGTTPVDREPDDAVVALVDLAFALTGVSEENRPSRAVSVVLCAAIALMAAFGVALATGGMKLPQVALGSGLFYTIFSGLGPHLFGVSAAFVVVAGAFPITLGGLALMNRFGPFIPTIAKVLAALLLVHFATMMGHFMAGAEPAACAGSSDFLCGTPLAGIFGRADGMELSANPFKFLGSIFGLLKMLKDFTLYDYGLLTESGNVLVMLWVWGVRAICMAIGLWMLVQFMGTISQAVGRLLGR